MGKIKGNGLPNIIGSFHSATPAHRAVYISAGAIFMPFPISCAIIFFIMVWVFFQKELRLKMFRQKGIPIISTFFILLLLVPFYWNWYLGILAGLGFIIVFLFFVFARTVVTKESFVVSMDICCVASIVPFIYALFEKIILGYKFRSTAGLLNANYYGQIIEFLVLICLWNIINNPNRQKFYYLILMMNIIGLFFCDSNSACMAIIIGVAVMLFLSGHWKAGFMFSIVSTLFVIISVTVPGILPRFDRMPQTFEKRVGIWKTALKGIKQHPIFGQGTLTYYFSYLKYGGYRTYHAHSIYLDPFLNYGVVGVCILVYYFTTVFRRVFQHFHISRLKNISLLILSVSIAVLVHGVTDTTILWIQTGMLYLLILSGVELKTFEITEKIK